MRILITIVISIFFFSGFAQKSDYIYNKLTTFNGLSSNDVLSEWQDKDGFIWVGTPNGLQRFDGKRFYNCPEFNKDVLNSEPVKQILGDSLGNIWMRVGNDFGIFNPANFTFKKAIVETSSEINFDSKLYTDETGNVFVIYRGTRVLKYDKQKNTFTGNLPFVLPKNWTINSMFYDKRTKNYWLSSNQGITIYSTIQKKIVEDTHLPLLNNEIFYNVSNIYIDAQRRIWILYWPSPLTHYQEFACYSDSLKKFLPNTKLIVFNNAYHVLQNILETDKGDIWIYGPDVLAHFDKRENKFISTPTGINSNQNITYSLVNQMFEDREHNIWVATDDGWYNCSPERPLVKNYFLNSKLKENYLSGVAVVNNDLWLSSWHSGVFILDSSLSSSHTIRGYPKEGDDRSLSWAICQSSKTNKVFIACQHGWLGIQDPLSLKNNFLLLPVFNKKSIRDIVEDKNKNLWFATQEGKILRYDPATPAVNSNFIEVQFINGIINRLFIDSRNRLWVCSLGGLYCIDISNGKIINTYRANGEKDKSLFDLNVTDIAQINDSIFAVAANNFHILNYNSGSIKRFTFSDGISSNKINCIVSDKQSNVWIETVNGISKYNYANNYFTRYTDRDGFITSSLFGDRGIRTKDGSIIIVGGNQVLKFNPADFNHSLPPPKVMITDVKLFESFLTMDSLRELKRINFNSNQNSLTFYFSTLSYFAGDKLNYYYRLKGSKQDWQKSENGSQVNYSLLPSGDYVFQIICKNDEGISSPISELAFTISSPFYFSWWFITLCIIFITADLYLIYRIQENKRKAVESMRSRVARDLHDDMGSTLSTINILSTMAKNRLAIDTVKTEQYINKISDNSQRMMDAMDDIVWSIKPDNDSMQKISGRMREFSTNVLEAKNIDLEFRVDESINDVRLNMTARRDFFLFFKEAVNNLAKYSKASKASIHLGLHNKKMVLIIKDNGVGFDIDKVDFGNGLNNMKKRADLLKARIQIQSKENVGTVITLNMNVR